MVKSRVAEIMCRVAQIQSHQKLLEMYEKEHSRQAAKCTELCKALIETLFLSQLRGLIVNEHTVANFEIGGPFLLSYNDSRNLAKIELPNGAAYIADSDGDDGEEFIVSDCGTMVAYYVAPNPNYNDKSSRYTFFPMSEIVIVPQNS